ncbi:MAG: NAD(P)/FAD-dependent oxidoreductase [Sphingomonas sp.]
MPARQAPPGAAASEPHVVILGAGFAGLACARALGDTPVRVTLVDRNNYHLFVPLLYQVATAALSPADIAEPIRKILRCYRNIEVVLGEVTAVDRARREVHLADATTLPYDRLVIATGSAYNYFGHDDWAARAPGLKTLDNARAIRARVLLGFELAEQSDDPAQQAALMTTVIVGAGPTGVEVAGAIAELARHALAKDFRRIDPRNARVLLVEAGPRILSTFPDDLVAFARRRLDALGVELWLGKAVEDVDGGGVTIGGQFVPAQTIVWGAGITASPAARWLGVEGDRLGRIPVRADLAVAGVDDIFALGDTALALNQDGKPLPALAQVAKQQGEYLGKALARNLATGAAMPSFRFHDRGNTAIVGRNAAIFDFGRHHLKGYVAWLLWALVHVYLLVGFDKRIMVSFQWLWRYLTYQRGARLITRDMGVDDRGGGPGTATRTQLRPNEL